MCKAVSCGEGRQRDQHYRAGQGLKHQCTREPSEDGRLVGQDGESSPGFWFGLKLIRQSTCLSVRRREALLDIPESLTEGLFYTAEEREKSEELRRTGARRYWREREGRHCRSRVLVPHHRSVALGGRTWTGEDPSRTRSPRRRCWTSMDTADSERMLCCLPSSP